MNWDAQDIHTLARLWGAGQSARQIGNCLGYSRASILGKVHRLNLKRGDIPPPAKPVVIVPVPQPVARPVPRRPQQLSKTELRAMLAEAVRNTSG
jgi:hypothetical protein